MLDAVIGASGDVVHGDHLFGVVVGDRKQIPEFPVSHPVIGDEVGCLALER